MGETTAAGNVDWRRSGIVVGLIYLTMQVLVPYFAYIHGRAGFLSYACTVRDPLWTIVDEGLWVMVRIPRDTGMSLFDTVCAWLLPPAVATGTAWALRKRRQGLRWVMWVTISVAVVDAALTVIVYVW